MAEPINYPNLQLELTDIGGLVKGEMIDTLYNNNSVVTGNLARSIDPSAVRDNNDVFSLDISMLTYGVYVNDGAERGPGRMPPVRAISEWIRLKRISVPAKYTTEQFAWAIAKNIAKKGQRFKKPKPFIGVSLEQVFRQNEQQLANAFGKDVVNYIEQNYSEIG